MTAYLVGLASQMGTSPHNLNRLMERGECSPGIAARIGTSVQAVEAFIAGTPQKQFAQAIGTDIQETDSLRKDIGRKGAISLIVGLACGVGLYGDE